MIIAFNPDCVGVVWFDDNVGVVGIGPVAGLDKAGTGVDVACARPAVLNVAVSDVDS
jgi:hypothetical protein